MCSKITILSRFISLKKNNGPEEERARDLFYALWIPDLFMKRVESDMVVFREKMRSFLRISLGLVFDVPKRIAEVGRNLGRRIREALWTVGISGWGERGYSTITLLFVFRSSSTRLTFRSSKFDFQLLHEYRTLLSNQR